MHKHELLFYKLSHCSQINHKNVENVTTNDVEKVTTNDLFNKYIDYQEHIKTSTTALLTSIGEGNDRDIPKKYMDFIQVVTDIRNIYHPIANNKLGK